MIIMFNLLNEAIFIDGERSFNWPCRSIIFVSDTDIAQDIETRSIGRRMETISS